MGKRFVVEDVRALTWSLRLRDTETGELIDIPMNPGSRFAPPGGHSTGAPVREQEANNTATDADPSTPPTRAPRKAAKKASRKKEPRPSAPADEAKRTETRERMPIDERSLTVDDPKRVGERRASLANALGARGKKGGLGWEETTDAGRSGLRARFKAGFFKILHAGGDVHGLFYEWDSGKYERIACGKAEDMMDIATKRALGDLPEPPRTMLDLELARLLCSTDAPPGAQTETRRAADVETPPRTRTRRSAAPSSEPSPSVTEPSSPSPTSPSSPPSTDTAPDPQRDAELMRSLSQALAEMED